MSDGELLCNFKKCRKVLSGTAYITRCSHAFCEDDGIKHIENQHFEKKCPACQSPLVKTYDLVKVTLNPSDQFKSMVLAGLRPEVVMDVATRAIMFWSYQQHQEQLHQAVVTKSLKDFMAQSKKDSEVETGFLKSEILSLKRKQEDTEKELEKQTQKCHELLEKLSQKTRDIQKWQMMYESLKRRELSAVVLQGETDLVEKNQMALNVGPQTMDDLMTTRAKAIQVENQIHPANRQADINLGRLRKSPGRKESDPNDGFIFQPRPMNSYLSPKAFLEYGNNYKFQGQKKYQV